MIHRRVVIVKTSVEKEKEGQEVTAVVSPTGPKRDFRKGRGQDLHRPLKFICVCVCGGGENVRVSVSFAYFQLKKPGKSITE